MNGPEEELSVAVDAVLREPHAKLGHGVIVKRDAGDALRRRDDLRDEICHLDHQRRGLSAPRTS